MYTETMPTVHITNYQQYIDSGFLFAAIADNLPNDVHWPGIINISIAYMQVTKKINVYTTTLALSILGKAYKFKLQHSNSAFYFAQYNLDVSSYASLEQRDYDICMYRRAFEQVVNRNLKQIIKAITCAYANK